MYQLSFDGLFRPGEEHQNPEVVSGIMCYGWIVYEDDQILAIGYGSYTHREVASSNGAEYLALIEGLEALKVLGFHKAPVTIVGDAKSVIDQMQGCASVTSRRIQTLHRKAVSLSHKMAIVEWLWVPRRQNKAADQLTRQALRQLRRTNQQPLATIGRTKKSTGFQLISDLMIYQPVV